MGVEIVEKAWRFLQSLSVSEIWQLAVAVFTVTVGLVTVTFKLTKLLIRLKPNAIEGELRKEITAKQDLITDLRADADHIIQLKATLETGIDEQALWKFRSASPPRDLLDRIHASPMKVLTFANYKGGVGKTTMAANIGAYFAKQGKRVLLIAFDYQGSLSSTVLRAAGRQEVQSHSDRLLTGVLTPSELTGQAYFLPPSLPQVALVPAGNALNVQEGRLALRWFLKMDDADPRFALVRLLSNADVLARFDVVIVDTPPRLSLATINALSASTHFAVPTILDSMSVENIGNLLDNVDTIFRRALNPNIKLAGIIGTMTEQQDPKDRELKAWESVADRAIEKWGPTTYFFKNTIPDTTRF
ncbi:MAG: ParA family protein, partial [Hyphomicrobium sp.]